MRGSVGARGLGLPMVAVVVVALGVVIRWLGATSETSASGGWRELSGPDLR